jgi:hypothetical protein
MTRSIDGRFPTPGPQGSTGDTDGDGIPDWWRCCMRSIHFGPDDAGLDPDDDGLTNLQEHNAGTNPRDAQSVLRLTSIAMALNETNMQFTFLAASNQAYSVLWKESFNAGKWTKRRTQPLSH